MVYEEYGNEECADKSKNLLKEFDSFSKSGLNSFSYNIFKS